MGKLFKTVAPAVGAGLTGLFTAGPGAGLAAAGSTLIGRMLMNDSDHPLSGENTVSGHGDYSINSNSVVGADNIPVFGGNGQGSIRVKHREFIQDIVSSATPGKFDIQSFAINPGLAETFPWLATLAKNFQQYRIHGLLFEYKTMSADALNSTNTALGTVVMTTLYDAYDKAPTAKQQMENTMFSDSVVPSQSLRHPIECQAFDVPTNIMYLHSGAIPLDRGDKRLYDMGNFYIATVGLQGSSVLIGELWITYDIELIKPQQLEEGSDSASDHYWAGDGNTVAEDALLSSDIVSSPLNSLGTTLANLPLVGLQINFPPSLTARINILYKIDTTGGTGPGALSPPTMTAFGPGCQIVNCFDLNATGQNQMSIVADNTAANVTNIGSSCYFDIQAGLDNFVELTGCLFAGMVAPFNSDLIITVVAEF